MYGQMNAVKAFHDKMGVAAQRRLTAPDDETCNALKRYAMQLGDIANKLLHRKDDGASMRMHLIIEETSELMAALINGDEVGALDALADLTYVVVGTAVMFDLPLSEAFDEVHASNMTKMKMPTDPHGERLRDKGPNYRPPDLTGVLENYRKGD